MTRVERHNSTRSKYTPELGKAKQELYRKAHKHLDRATNKGSHIEVIAILESLMSDRLESAISSITGQSQAVNSLGSLISKFHQIHPLDEELRLRLHEWNRHRSQIIHQIVKLTENYTPTWAERITFARRIAAEGKILLKELRKVTDKVIRNSRHV